MSTALTIRGAKGGGGATEAPDTIRTTQIADIIDLVSEGECLGLANGLKSIYLDGVPLQAQDGTFNFTDVQVQVALGTQGQAALAGLDGVQNEVAVGVDVKAQVPAVRTIVDPDVDTVRVTIAIPQISETDTSSGDLHGSSFGWKIELQSNGGGFVQVMAETVTEKSMSRWTIEKRFALTGSAPWDVRVSRTTADSTSASIVNGFQWASYTEITSVKLRWPNTSYIRLRLNAQYFSSVPARTYDWMAQKISVPTNYNPYTRTYTGVWDGTFRQAWSNNAAWVWHEVLRNTRFGLGRYVPAGEQLKWMVYTIARYCDGLVPDGYGGQEPRFRCDIQITDAQQAMAMLRDLAGIFMGITYWLNTDAALSQDAPADPVALFTPSNVVGKFTYGGASDSSRHTQAIVWWHDLSQQGKLVPEVVPALDPTLEARLGVRPLNITPLGIWSRGQAQRAGKWALYTEHFATQTVQFRVGLDGVQVAPGKVFQIADPGEAGERLGGRIKSATASQVVLDAPVTLAAGETYTLSVMVQDPANPTRLMVAQAPVITAAGTTDTVDLAPALPSAPAAQGVWMLQSTNVEATWWRCISVMPVKGSGNTQFDIVGLVHTPQKYDLIEQGIAFDAAPVSRITLTSPPVASVAFVETVYKVGSIARSRVTTSWPAPAAGLTYLMAWRSNAGAWTTLGPTSANSLDVDALTAGLFEVKVWTRNAIGSDSVIKPASTTVLGDQAPAADPQNFTATVVQGGVKFEWTPDAEDLYLTSTLKVDGQVRFEGAASSYTWPWPDKGTYDVTLTHWTTSLKESQTPAELQLVVDDAMLTQWSAIAGRPLDQGNLVHTPVFESGGLGLWATEAPGQCIVVDVSGQAWTKAIQVNARDSYEGQEFSVRAGETLFIGADLDASTSDVRVTFGVGFKTAGHAFFTWAAGLTIAAGTGWTRGGDAITVPAGAVWGSPWLQLDAAHGDVSGPGQATNLYIGRAELGATVGAPAGTSVAGVLAEQLVQAASDAATAASNAQVAATSALTQLTAIASDNVLSAGEKPAVILDCTVITNERSGIDTQATAYGVTAQALAYDASIAALTSYLGSLTSPTAWNDTSGSTTIVGTTFRANFAAVYAARQTLLNAISIEAKARLGALATLDTVNTPQIVDGAVSYTVTFSDAAGMGFNFTAT